MIITKLGNHRYQITNNGEQVGLVSVCRGIVFWGQRTQWYQVQLPSGEVLKEYTSVRIAAEAARLTTERRQNK